MLHIIPVLSYFISLLLLVALAYRDLKEYILPNALNAALVVSFSAFHISTKWQIISPADALMGATAGAGILLVIRFFANHFYKEDALGLGDVKLMAAAGVGLGFPDILLATSLGAAIGLIHGLWIALARRREGHNVSLEKINVPAGLGLTLGIAIVMISQLGFSWLQ